MSRDPKTEPTFGDVFEIDTGARTYRAMFVQPVSNGEWRGIQLDVVAGPPLGFIDTGDLRIFVTTTKWKFIEHIDGHATGGLLSYADYRSMSWREIQMMMRLGANPAPVMFFGHKGGGS